MDEHGADAPIAYPELHHVTAPLRRAGRESGDGDVVNLWAGEAHELAEALPAAEVVARLAAGARDGGGRRRAAGLRGGRAVVVRHTGRYPYLPPRGLCYH